VTCLIIYLQNLIYNLVFVKPPRELEFPQKMRPAIRLYSNSPAAATTSTIEALSKLLPNAQAVEIPANTEEDISPPGPFSSSLYFSKLNKGTRNGRVLIHAEEIASTQTLILENSACDDSVVCVADRQTSGRGRGANTWESPLGCLMFSFRSSFPARYGSKLPFFQYLVSLALVRGCTQATEGGCEVNIKWPNDIYANRSLKVGGILCQSHHDGGKFVVTTGVGLNVENEQPTTCLSALAKRRVRREIVLAEFFNAFDDIYTRFLEGDGESGPSFNPFIDEYITKWLHTGQKVEVDDAKQVVTIKGISPVSGALVAQDDHGRMLELTPDGNRLDFFRGLVSKKIAT
jgi:biotin--protein ligase